MAHAGAIYFDPLGPIRKTQFGAEEAAPETSENLGQSLPKSLVALDKWR
jgi:hypothetical protein